MIHDSMMMMLAVAVMVMVMVKMATINGAMMMMASVSAILSCILRIRSASRMGVSTPLHCLVCQSPSYHGESSFYHRSPANPKL